MSEHGPIQEEAFPESKTCQTTVALNATRFPPPRPITNKSSRCTTFCGQATGRKLCHCIAYFNDVALPALPKNSVVLSAKGGAANHLPINGTVVGMRARDVFLALAI